MIRQERLCSNLNQLPKKEMLKIIQSLWMSKLRYGLQLCNQVRVKREDPVNQNMKSAQVAQNKKITCVIFTKLVLLAQQDSFPESRYIVP